MDGFSANHAFADMALASARQPASLPSIDVSKALQDQASVYDPAKLSTYLVPKIGYNITDDVPTVAVPTLTVCGDKSHVSWTWPSSFDQPVIDNLMKQSEADETTFSNEQSATQAVNSALSTVITSHPGEIAKKSGMERSLARRILGGDRVYSLGDGATIIFGDLPKEHKDSSMRSRLAALRENIKEKFLPDDSAAD